MSLPIPTASTAPPPDAAAPARGRSAWRDMRRLLGFLRGQGGRMLRGMLAVQAGTWLQLCFSIGAGGLIDGTLHRTGDASNVWVEKLRPWLEFHDINRVGMVLGVIMLAVVACRYIEYTSFFEAGERAIARLRQALFARLVHLPMGFYSQRRVGDLSSRLLTDLTQVQEHWVNDLRQIQTHGTVVLGSLVFMIITSAKMSLVFAVVVPVTVVGAMLIGRNIRREARLTQARLGETAVILEETLQGIQHVKVNAAEDWETQRYGASLERALGPAIRGGKQRALFICTIVVILLGAWVYLMWQGSRLVQGTPGHPPELSPGSLTTFMFCVAFALSSGGTLAEVASRFSKASAAASRVVEILEEPAETAPAVDTAGLPARLRGEVTFDAVHFSYPGRPDLPVLDGLSLAVRAGEKIALVGPSGAGKSTLAALACRLFDPVRGEVLIDGRPAREYPLQWLRGQMAFVPQEILLFGGTVAENIAYAAPDTPREAIREAAAKARALEFIDALPQGLDTPVGDRGSRLSGGQRQRLALARAILRDPAILILDEATSALDSQNEKLIQEALDEVMASRTSFIIAHRLSTVRRVDRIVVLEGGRIVEIGTHAELHGRGGVYRDLCDHQYFDPGQPEMPMSAAGATPAV